MRPQTPRHREPADVVTLHINVPAESAASRRAVNVLLLEDRADFRNLIHDYLVGCGYGVTPVESGVEGVREIVKRPFDLIICDMMMPKMGGEMFYWAVTRVRPAAAQRFIFFTGYKNNPALEAFFSRIKAKVLYKPFKFSQLELAIRDVFRAIG